MYSAKLNVLKVFVNECEDFQNSAEGKNLGENENDVFIICDDVIIIAEVKAGLFKYTPAITDFVAHKKSFKALIGKADYQCACTLEYINRFDEETQQTLL